MAGTAADYLAAALRQAGVERVYGVVGDFAQRLHRLAAPPGRASTGSICATRKPRHSLPAPRRTSPAGSRSAPAAAAPATCISSMACSTATAAAFRCWRSRRTSRAARSASTTSRQRIRRSSSANAATMSSWSPTPRSFRRFSARAADGGRVDAAWRSWCSRETWRCSRSMPSPLPGRPRRSR